MTHPDEPAALDSIGTDGVAFLHTITTKPTTLNPSICTSC